MFYILCPFCHAKLEIPADAIGLTRTDLYNVIHCDECNMSFDYDDEEIAADTVFDKSILPGELPTTSDDLWSDQRRL
ncbi:MAG TPA: hypothetical protein VGN12_28010 [Pirellulales bacterium]|jgi:hypothetical protein